MVVTDEKLVEEIIERPIKPEARSRAGPERPGQRQGGRAGGPSEPRRRRQSEARPGLLDRPAEAWWQGPAKAAEAERVSQELGTGTGVSRQAATPVD